MLFGSRKKNTTVISIDDMLSFRNTWKSKPTPEFDFVTLLKDARTVKAVTPAVLHTTENGYKVVDQSKLDDQAKTIRIVQSTLNKLTEKNYKELLVKILELELLETNVIEETVSRIYDKALDEPAFSPWYAQLCLDICMYAHECNSNGKPANIHGDMLRVAVVARAQATFDDISHANVNADEAEVTKLRKKKLANIKFVGELFVRRILKKSIMNSIIGEIFHTEQEHPEAPNAMDAEVGLEFLNVVGKELEAQGVDLRRLWDVIRRHMASNKFNTRLRFLYQNLLDLQEAKWVRKEEPVIQESTAPPPPPPPPANLHKASSAFPSSASLSNLAQQDEQVSADHKKAVLARAPQSFDKKQQRKVVSLIMDTLLDGKWDNTKADFATMVPGEPAHVSRMACFYGMTTELCMSAKEGDRKSLTTGLTHSSWDKSEVCRGVAWALTEAIVMRTVEDCPKFYERYVETLAGPLAASHINIITAIRDVFARTSNYLDALYNTCDGNAQWDVDFITIWEDYLKRCVALGKDIPSIAEVLDSLGSVRQTPFMQGILMDFVQAMISANLCTKDEIEQWHQSQSKNPKVKELAAQLGEMILF